VRKFFITLTIFFCFSTIALGQDTPSDAAVQWRLHAAFWCLLIALILAVVYLVGVFHAARDGTSGRWARKWEFSPRDLGGFSWHRLALWSLLSLFLELLMIRWISSEIRIFAYFKNFVLMACFLGFGLGCYLSRRRVSLLPTLVPLLTLALIANLPWQSLRTVITALPSFVGASSDIYVWGVPSVFSFPLLAGAMAVLVPIFSLIAFSFIPLGQLIGWYIENASHGIMAYSVNVLASLAGILLYTLLCFLYQPPVTWFFVVGLLLVCLVWRLPWLRWGTAVAVLICLGILSLGHGKQRTVYWSPYQKLTLAPRQYAGKVVAYDMTTNDTWYQQILDLSPKFVVSQPQFFQDIPIEWNAYNLPYHFYPQPPSVLILGSGLGNDVAAALRNGAEYVTAVEIDPLILQIGERLHFEKPYSSSRVRTVQDDARSYVQNSNEHFDLIVFSLLDSHTTNSHFTNIRIDNYVYTLEALQQTKRLLKPDGILVVKFQVDTPWIAGRLYGLLNTVFGQAPLQIDGDQPVFYSTGGRFFIAGSQGRIRQASAESSLAAYLRRHSKIAMEPATLTTDDWPYFYQHKPGLPLSVILISVALIILSAALIRDTGTKLHSFRWHFFFLGAGFLLLEAQIISKMALLFGTSWVVNSIIIAGLLVLIVAANLLVEFKPLFPVNLAYAGIFVSLAASYFIPLQKFFFASLWVRILTATVVLCLPVFFAGIVFIRSFATEGFRGEALGSNLFGAMIGGVLESASLWTGIRFLLVIVALLYLASWFALRLGRKLGEVPSLGEEDAFESVI